MAAPITPRSWKYLNILFVCLAVIFALSIGAGWFDPVRAQGAKPDSSTGTSTATPQTTTPPSSSGGTSLEDARNRLDVLKADISNQATTVALEKEEISHLNEISRLLMTIAGVFTLILGAASWKTLDDQRKQARESQETQKATFTAELEAFLSSSKNLLEESLNKSKESLRQTEQLRDEVERDFPMFGRMGSNFSRVLIGLAAACATLKMDDRTYSSLSWEEEQRILFYESAMSTSMLLHTENRSKDISEIYRLLGVFYGSKFYSSLSEGKLDASAKRHDLNRSRFYFDRSIELNEKNYLAYLSAGYFTQYYDDHSIVAESRGYFEKAAIIGSRYQKPCLSIALIELEAFHDPDKALQRLDEAAQRPEYDITHSDPSLDFIEYVKACAYCFKAKQKSSTEITGLLGQALESLTRACANNNEYVRAAFAKERDEYFDILESHADFQSAFLSSIEKLSGSSQTMGPSH